MNEITLSPRLHNIVRSAIFDWLARLVADKCYEVDLNKAAYQTLQTLYAKKILPSQAPGNIPFENLHAYQVPKDVISLITQIFWELHLQGVLIPSPAWISSSGGRSAIITSYGIELLEDTTGRIQTHDPDGYLSNFMNENPLPDREMLIYITESIAVFQDGHLFACVILLGVASERLITVLAENLRDSLGEPNGNDWFKKKYRGNISDKFDAVVYQLLNAYGNELEREKLKDALQGIVRQTFENIRHARNDIAHPSGREFTWNEVSGLLHNFVQYFKQINKIMAFLTVNPKKQITRKSE